jgi:hypothetical protein
METPFRLGVFMIPATGTEHRLRGFEKATSIPVAGNRGLGGVISNALRSVLTEADAGADTNAGIAGVHWRSRHRPGCRSGR